jgi:hypothetical protein
MFDAKNLLESLVRGAGSRSRQHTGEARGEGGLGDLIGQLTRGTDAPTREGASQSGGLGDLLRNLQSGQGGGGGLGDLLRNLQQQGGQGGLADTLRQVLGQATQGTREGAGRLGEATGAREAITRMSGGRSPEDLLA